MANEKAETTTAETVTVKIKPNAPLAGASLGAIVAWGWNAGFPEVQMPAEVAAPLGALLGPVIRWFIAWLPEPQRD